METKINSHLAFLKKVDEVTKHFGTEKFSPAETVPALVNQMDAQKKFSMEDYLNVRRFINVFKEINEEVYLSYWNFFLFCDEIIAHFDLIVPYYKICGNDNPKVSSNEPEKDSYRLRAKKILKDEPLFGDAWMDLYEEFIVEFYPALRNKEFVEEFYPESNDEKSPHFIDYTKYKTNIS